MTSDQHRPQRLSAVSEWIGSPEQLVQLRELQHTNGQSAGERLIQAQNAAGLQVDILPDRGLDLGGFSYRGTPLVWISGTGMARPGGGAGASDWLRGFGGGLLSTCGLDSFGPGSQDQFGSTSLHGLISSQRATVTRQEVLDSEITVAGMVRQVRVLGEDLELRRTISIPIGEAVVRVRDEITNHTDRQWPHMLLYHMNFGWPLISPDAAVHASFRQSSPRDEEAEHGMPQIYTFQKPVQGFNEQVFHHEQQKGSGWNTVTIENPVLGLALEIRTIGDQLPYLHQWKMMGHRSYALGLEPSNCPSMSGRAEALHAGLVPMLATEETKVYEIEVRLRDVA